ncbi:MAG: DUF3179 domain-containing protein [Nitrospirae bacterium]|nr:DUF3179 domain-containing protein [Nitrospirota bacterium]
MLHMCADGYGIGGRIKIDHVCFLMVGVLAFACGENNSPIELQSASDRSCRAIQPLESGAPRGPLAGGFQAIDRQSGSEWNVFGEAVAGSMAEGGRRLETIGEAFTAYWFAWSAIWPGAEVWGREARPNAAVKMPETLADGSLKPSCSAGRDCIPALRPTWVGAGNPAAFAYLTDEDEVVGIRLGGSARAYPHKILWRHEAINDVLAGAPMAVTHSALTRSTVVFDTYREGESPLDLGVTGSLYNSNTVFYDRETDSFWSQMRMQIIRGPLAQSRWGEAKTCPFVETTWKTWRTLFPETEVISEKTGFDIDYRKYPYTTPRAGEESDVDYRTDDADTFRPTVPPVDHLADPGQAGYVGSKDLAFGVIQKDAAKFYLWKDLSALGERAAVNDTVGGVPIVVFWDAGNRWISAYHRDVEDRTLEFESR